MAAFPYPHHNLFLFEDPPANFLQNPHFKMPEYSEQPKITTSFQQFYTPEPHFHQIPLNVGVHENGCFLENTTNVSLSTDSSSVVINKPESTGDSQVTQKVSSMDKKRKNIDGSSISSVQFKGAREVKVKRQKKCNRLVNTQEEKKDLKQAPEGYIHVRARRGQATDSHSLAERVRREKISERMKLLQSLVPGCEKVSGKALMLDEIINYVQSLQYQVEFLSMKLTSMNPMFYDFGMDMDALMVTPERLNGLVSPLQNIHECNPIQANFATPLLGTPSSSSSTLFQHEHGPNILPQENRQLLWDVDEQRQKHMNQSGFSINNLCSFH